MSTTTASVRTRTRDEDFFPYVEVHRSLHADGRTDVRDGRALDIEDTDGGWFRMTQTSCHDGDLYRITVNRAVPRRVSAGQVLPPGSVVVRLARTDRPVVAGEPLHGTDGERFDFGGTPVAGQRIWISLDSETGSRFADGRRFGELLLDAEGIAELPGITVGPGNGAPAVVVAAGFDEVPFTRYEAFQKYGYAVVGVNIPLYGG
ncbi:hypothetical protein ACFC1R_32800 [Kitasatospora sp. NPDC056138]|uniref:hypothetical protein n=1 Tax=Kitasatospora sp. NPDC056138 TaxID=3345724 RepID=UPI0035E33BDF